ncbi:MAG: efflux transporter periplasmic adaptor subunit, partial [Gammaproteobacteria bacterium]
MNKQLLTGLIVGIVVGVLAVMGLTGLVGRGDESDVSGGQKQPLYWVAPMDPSYRRDGPGKSP